jgi:hypothetical protein
MDAQILPGADISIGAPKHQIFTQQAGSHGLSGEQGIAT